MSQQTVSRIERGRIGPMSAETLERVIAALDGRLDVRIWWRGGELDRLIDARHAALVEATVARLRGLGWQAAVEVSYSEYGERGSIDVLGWLAGLRILLVVEVKATIASVEETNRRHDQKFRLAAKVARTRLGWVAAAVVRVLVLPDEPTARRAVARHAETFDSVLPVRGRSFTSWLRQPIGPVRGGIWFVSPTHPESGNRSCVTSRRVRSPRGRGS